ncbi:4238_t:CDS:2, partial [Racocetra fulgida]
MPFVIGENVKDNDCFRLFETHPFSPSVTQKPSALQSSDHLEKRNEPKPDISPYIISPPHSMSKLEARSSTNEGPVQQNSSSMPIPIIGNVKYKYTYETGTITSRDIPKLQNNLQKNNSQNNLQNTSSNFSSRTTNQVDHSYTARLTSNADMPSQRVDSPSLTEGGSSGFSVDGRSTPSNSLNAFQMSNTTLYYNGIEVPPPGARIIPLELQMQIGKEIMAQREDSRISLLPYLGSKYKLSDLPS